VQVVDAGDARFITGEQVERAELLDENDRVLAEGRACDLRAPVCSASPRRPSHRFVHSAAVVPGDHPGIEPKRPSWARRDDLRGLIENVIVGRLIPAGTGPRVSTMPGSIRRLSATRKQVAETGADSDVASGPATSRLLDRSLIRQ